MAGLQVFWSPRSTDKFISWGNNDISLFQVETRTSREENYPQCNAQLIYFDKIVSIDFNCFPVLSQIYHCQVAELTSLVHLQILLQQNVWLGCLTQSMKDSLQSATQMAEYCSRQSLVQMQHAPSMVGSILQSTTGNAMLLLGEL